VRIAAIACLALALGTRQAPPPDLASVEALAAQPSGLAEPAGRIVVYRALDAPSPEIVAAAIEVMLRHAELTADPMLWRRFNSVLSGTNAARRSAVLDRAARQGLLDDIRVVSVVVEGLTDADATLKSTALALVKSNPALEKNPAIAEALAHAGERATGLVLPDLEVFKARVQPVLETAGPDKKTCASCHDTHSVLRLPEMDSAASPDAQIRARYRAALRVVDLEAPERSLILRKPTSPKADAPLTHGGDVRFEKDSPAYQAILEWIKTGRMAR
jgi:hypothetical protein